MRRVLSLGLFAVLLGMSQAAPAPAPPAMASTPAAPATTVSAGNVSIVLSANAGAPAQHGAQKLEAALNARGWSVQRVTLLSRATGELIVQAQVLPALPDSTGPAIPESLNIKHTEVNGRPALVLSAVDDRGLMYAELDVADRVGWAKDAAQPFSEVKDVTEKPFVRDRSLSVYTMNRAYWESRFYNEDYWAKYFDLLAASRFNKFLIVFGYENAGFLAPPYPYFFETPGFPDVKMVNLNAEQQKKNFAALNRLIEIAHARGIAVAVGIWDHIFRGGVQSADIEWAAQYTGLDLPSSVRGLTSENLNAYTMASLKKFLDSFPVDEIQFRIHEESGLKREEIDDFWKNAFTMAKETRPDILFEARGKGTPDSVINTALDLGLNMRVETKYWMEQMGLPFHPTQINPPDQTNRRHGYADFLRFPQRYRMNWRLWNGGTTRILLWADPEYVLRFSASTSIYDSPNWDVNEPLATKMEGQAPTAAPFNLMPERYRYYTYEFERYWPFFQVWGRIGYNPNTGDDVLDAEYIRRFGEKAGPIVRASLKRASEVLPYIVASSVYPYSAFPMTVGWAERQILGNTLGEYGKNTGTDVQQFEGLDEAAQRIFAERMPLRTPPEAVSKWLDQAAEDILRNVQAAEKAAAGKGGKEFDSMMTDQIILADLARFHARRSLAAVHYNLYRWTGELHELDDAIAGERSALESWRWLVNAAGDRYSFDLMMGIRSRDLAGHWRDEILILERSVAALEKERANAAPLEKGFAHVPILKTAPNREVVIQATAAPKAPLRLGYGADDNLQWVEMTEHAPGEFRANIPAPFVRPGLRYAVALGNAAGLPRIHTPIVSADNAPPALEFTPVAHAEPSQPLRITVQARDPAGIEFVRLRYRSLTQFDNYAALEMQPTGAPGEYAATVPAEALNPQWDFVYFFEAMDKAGNGALYPDFQKEMPYIIVNLHAAAPAK